MDMPEGYPNRLPRACLNCRIIKTFAEFFNEGCPNCERYMKFKYNFDKVAHCSTVTFSDLCFLPEGFNKWVTRLKPVESFATGCYAYHVLGIIPYRYMYELQSEDRQAESGEYCI